jgi:ferritin-like metal-binding protein YciE
MEKMNDLRDLLKHEIEDLYSAEEQIIAALPKMMGKATDKNLKSALSQHLDVTERQKKRLDEVRELMGEMEESGKKKGFLSGLLGGGKHTCKAMEGIIEEGNKVVGEDMTPRVRDAAIIASSQKIEHYEICGYGTARTYAWELGLEKVAKLLEQTLNEEYEADNKLTALAVNKINPEAEAGGTGRSGRSGSEAGGRGSSAGSRERVNAEEMEMEAVSNRSGAGASSKSTSQKRGSSPSGSPRSSGSGRASASSGAAGKGTKKASASNSRSSSSRGSSSTGRSSKGR